MGEVSRNLVRVRLDAFAPSLRRRDLRCSRGLLAQDLVFRCQHRRGGSVTLCYVKLFSVVASLCSPWSFVFGQCSTTNKSTRFPSQFSIVCGGMLQ